MAEVLDLDKLIEDKRKVKLAGKEIDVSKIPSKISLKILDKYDELSEDNPESMNLVVDMIVDIINSQNEEEITEEWLMDKTSIKQLMKLIEFVMAPINEKVEQDDTKN